MSSVWENSLSSIPSTSLSLPQSFFMYALIINAERIRKDKEDRIINKAESDKFYFILTVG